jgi:integrase
LTGHALELIEQHAKRHADDSTTLLFNGSGRVAFENSVKRAGIENFSFHDLRHSAASYLAMNGASLMEIAEILGHKTLSMVKRYAHLSEAHTAGVVARMNQAIFGQ